jgi:hypothetical protein
MQYILKIRQLYDEYLSDTARLQAAMKATDGMLGLGRRPDSDPCHERFMEQLGAALDAMAFGAPSSADTAEVLRFMVEKPSAYRGNSLVYIMLLAVHGMAASLIPFLSPPDAAALSARYVEEYPKNTWLPAQKKIATLLKKQAGGAAPDQKPSLMDRLRGRKQN